MATRALRASTLASGIAATLGYRVIDLAGVELVALTAGTMTEQGTTAEYDGAATGWDDAWSGYIEWYDGATRLYTEAFAATAAATLAAPGLLAPRDLSAVADAALTPADGLVAAVALAAGNRDISGTSLAVRTPAGTTIAAKSLDSATAPTRIS